jgi:hypothetical protein
VRRREREILGDVVNELLDLDFFLRQACERARDLLDRRPELAEDVDAVALLGNLGFAARELAWLTEDLRRARSLRDLYEEVEERRRRAALEMARGLSVAPVVVFHEGEEVEGE